MKNLPNTAVKMAIVPVAKTTPWACTGICVDTQGYNEAMFILSLSAQATVQTVVTITEGTTTTPATAITSPTTADLSTTAVHTGAGGNIVVFNLDLKYRARYLRINFTGGANVTVSAVCVLSGAEKNPLGGTERIWLANNTPGDAAAETCVYA